MVKAVWLGRLTVVFEKSSFASALISDDGWQGSEMDKGLGAELRTQ